MRVVAAFGIASLVATVTWPARAQTPAPGGHVTAPAPQGPNETIAAPSGSPGGASAVGDDTTTANAAWDRALDALVHGDLDQATVAFADVAAQSTNDARRATARELMDRIAHAKSTGRTTETIAASGKSPPAPGSSSPERTPQDDDGGPTHEGRLTTLAITTALGLGVYGWTVPNLLDLDGRAYVGTYMLVAGASFGVPFLLTRERPVTWPMAGLGFWGGTRGIAHGAMVAALISPNSTSDKGLAGAILIGSTTELISGLAWGARDNLTPGAAHTIGVAGDVGLLLGLGLAHVTGIDQYSRPDAERDRDTGLRVLMGMGLAGTVGGVAGGWLLSERRDRSFGDVEVTRAAGVVGAWTAATVAIVAGVDNSRIGVGSVMVGGIAGLVAGDHLVRDTHFGFAQSVFVDLATLAGGLAGAGIAYLATPDVNSVKPYFVASTLGAGGGFALLTLTQLDRARARRRAHVADTGLPARLALFPTIGRDGHRGLALGGAF